MTLRAALRAIDQGWAAAAAYPALLRVTLSYLPAPLASLSFLLSLAFSFLLPLPLSPLHSQAHPLLNFCVDIDCIIDSPVSNLSYFGGHIEKPFLDPPPFCGVCFLSVGLKKMRGLAQ